MTGLRLTLISGRSLEQARGKIVGKFSEEYQRNVAVCEFNAEDLKSLAVVPGQNVRLSIGEASVVLKATLGAQQIQKGITFVPYGPWINSIMPSQTSGTGMPLLKGIEVDVTPAPNENVADLETLIGRIRMRGKIGHRF